MPNPVERGKQRSTVTAFRVAISGSCADRKVSLRSIVSSTNSVTATSYTLQRYARMYPNAEVHQIRVSIIKPNI